MQCKSVKLGLTKRGVSTFFALLLPAQFALADSSPAENSAVATLAGGCFWCVESDLEKLSGVSSVISGYSGGDVDNPTYKAVSSGKTGHIEVVQVTYNPEKISYEALLDEFFRHIDPTDNQGSFVDRGRHYRPAIFYHNDIQQQVAASFMAEIDKANIFPKPLATELIEFSQFWPAEEYHQDYYKKNSIRYRYYRHASGRDQYLDEVFGDDRDKQPQTIRSLIQHKQSISRYTKPSAAAIKAKLSALQFDVTQHEATERPFDNEYWDNKEEGIYVDVVTGEPLFSSTDKYKSGTGWPSFTQPINEAFITTKTDYKLLYPRTEIRSRVGDSHLGHLFTDGPKPTGLRYCMNSAAMTFIAKNELKKQGYEEYLTLFK
ncbi:methionine sulfoxide reductase [Vibrio sp. 10N.286.49.B3]|uniref:peptide-methionine (R)-S-oxide reductase MsrB n=1 Tax=Vibrio sp. 10N.286.49.B3 TaxID=1880855 RepID=UPI000C817154|nr:peptide-methionine (R)-S-oxide reductase MsrB [Vibrio sp. 10N.286.49.B3]PMH42665.1 methionine sulfoxide reductase [Vibrio sp. 10N.286.49.B3]